MESDEIARLWEQLSDARVQVRTLTAVVAERDIVIADQAKALAAITDDCPPFAPTVACCYWLYSQARCADKSWRYIWNRLRPLVSGVGELLAPRITPMVWERHRARRRLDGICDHTANIELWRAKELLNWAVANKLMKFNPIAIVKAVPTVSRRETWLPLADVNRLLEAAPKVIDGRLPKNETGHRGRVLRAFVLATHDSMLRFNEARLLRRGRIGADGRVELASRQTKGAKRRTIFLTPRTLKAIDELPKADDVFADETGRLIPEQTLRVWFTKMCVIAGVNSRVAPGEQRVRPHDLRASGASTADENGARATAIRDALGHSALSTTEVYLRSGQARNAETVCRVMADATRSPPQRSGGWKRNGAKKSC